MPNSVTSSNNAVATLMYHCGVSVDMGYGVGSPNGNGSSAQTLDVVNALKNYFNYDNSIQGLYRSSYSDAQWISLLKVELNSNRPIQYAGTGNLGGHSFVCDGYDNSNYFHFNWGWSGSSDGYFNLNALNPGSLGTGGGSGGFNSNQRAIVGIKPPPVATYSLKLYNTVTPSSSSISYGQAFSVSTNITNNGTASFSGDYCAAIFDNTNTFVDYVEIKTGQSLQNGYHYTNNLVFSNTGIVAMMPATYKVAIYHRPTGGQWALVADNGSYTNFPTITVTYNNNIALNSVITPTPSTLVKGQAASFNLNIKNISTPTFFGKYYLALYNLDGSLAQLIDSIAETNGLQNGYTYSLPYLNFNTQVIKINPGTYLMAAFHYPNGGSVQLTGANSYQNPTKVIVKAADLLPDIYEVNDTLPQAYPLPVTFVGKTSNPKTTGSNCHKGNDYDFYKVTLPIGYNYSITPRIHDSYNSGNGNTYTLDGLFSYSLNGITWSEAYDDTITSKILQTNGGTIYFAVAPYFAGGTGTYLLDIKLDKVASYVNGNLITPIKKAISNVNIKISKDSTGTSLVNSKYESILNYDGNYTIRPTKNNDITKANGINATDVLFTQRHILNTTKLNSAYKIIAADVNGDKIVNATDVLRIKRLILGTDTTFTKGTGATKVDRLWEFVDSAYQFPDTTNPFPFKDSISFTNLTSNKINQTFIGVKLGDVNYDWNPAVAKGVALKNVELQYTIDNKQLANTNEGFGIGNSVIRIPITANNFKDIAAMQYTLHFDNSKYEFVNLEGFKNLEGFDYNTAQANTNGNISFVWTDKNAVERTLEDGTEIFVLVLRSTVNRQPSTDLALSLTIDLTEIAAWDKDYNQHNIILSQKLKIKTQNINEVVIYPNPTKGLVNLYVETLVGKGNIVIADVYGKQVKTQPLNLGTNTVDIANLSKGIYFVSVITNEGKTTKKLVVE
jgi:hypothetical protein